MVCRPVIHNNVPGEDAVEFIPGGSVRISISEYNCATTSTLVLYNTEDRHLAWSVSTRVVCDNNFTYICIIIISSSNIISFFRF